MCQTVPCPGEVPHVWTAPHCKPSLVVKTIKRRDWQWRENGGEKHMGPDARASGARYKDRRGSANETSSSTRPFLSSTFTTQRLISTSYQYITSQTMVVKRDAPSSPTPSEYASPPSPAPSNDYSPTGKRIKSAKTPTPKKKSPAKTPKAKADGVITNEMKAELTEAAMDAAYKGSVAFSAYEAKVCLSLPEVSRC
jgi:hypothetical protein